MKLKKLLNDKPDLVVSIASLIVAASAVIISLTNSFVVIRNNKLMVKPKLELSVDHSIEKMGIYIENNGMGPAIMKKFKISIGDSIIDGLSKQEMRALDAVLENLGMEVYTSTHGAGNFLVRGSSPVIQFIQAKNDSAKWTFKNLMDDLAYQIEYESIYGEVFFVPERDQE